MEGRFYQQLKKGVLEMLVLKLICDGPTYGYGLLQQLKDRSESRFSLKEGSVKLQLYINSSCLHLWHERSLACNDYAF